MAVRRVAVIGCGDVSAVHFDAIRSMPELDLVAVCDTDPGRLAAASETWGVPGFASHTDLLAEVDLDAVHVTTPHHQHVPVSIDALAAGVHVLQEKPIAHTIAEGERLVAAAEQSSARLGICFQNRYNVSAQQMHRLLSSGELGEVLGAYATVVWSRTPDYYQSRPWRAHWSTAGGGLLINQAIHTLDLVQWLLGGVTEVSGHAASRRYGEVSEVEDVAEALFTHPSGARTVFFGSLAASSHRPVELEVETEAAFLRLRNGLDLVWKDGRPAEHWDERQVATSGRSYWGVSHELLISDFHARLDDPEPFWIGPAEALTSLHMLKQIYAQSGLDKE